VAAPASRLSNRQGELIMAKSLGFWRGGLYIATLVSLFLAGPVGAAIDLSILPADMVQQPGDTILVQLTVVNESSAFNAYDARITYDPQRLLFLRMSPVTAQEGPLMTGACPNRFHIFTIAPDSTYLQINHSLLCAGVNVTGPGVVYRLRFRCRALEGPTSLGFGLPTAFYDDGLYVNPVNLAGAVVQIGGSTPAPEVVPARVGITTAPNPFNPRTTITFDLPAMSLVRLAIYDPSGRRVRGLVDDMRDAGRNTVNWDGRDDAGRSVATGTYFARIDAGDFHQACKMVLMK
jgi:hypothetical protein